jgi:hypothetical protein
LINASKVLKDLATQAGREGHSEQLARYLPEKHAELLEFFSSLINQKEVEIAEKIINASVVQTVYSAEEKEFAKDSFIGFLKTNDSEGSSQDSESDLDSPETVCTLLPSPPLTIH